jgi:hypothetical protein
LLRILPSTERLSSHCVNPTKKKTFNSIKSYRKIFSHCGGLCSCYLTFHTLEDIHVAFSLLQYSCQLSNKNIEFSPVSSPSCEYLTTILGCSNFTPL